MSAISQAAFEGLNSTPMEGFDANRVKRILGLPRRAEINMVIRSTSDARDPAASVSTQRKQSHFARPFRQIKNV